jgi:hypothetical protein
MTLEDLVAKMCKQQHWTSEPDGAGLAIEIPQPKGRKQKVLATAFKDKTDPMVRFTSNIGPADQIEDRRAKMALELNSKLPHGCLAIAGDQLVVTATRPLKTTTPESSAAAVVYLANQADTYERLIFSGDVH